MKTSISFVLGALLLVSILVGFHYYQEYATLNNVQANNTNSGDDIFQVASSTGDVYLTVTSDGLVGVNNTAPTTALDVRGVIRTYASSTPSCTTAIEGAIVYSGWQKHFFGCNGSVWKQLDQ